MSEAPNLSRLTELGSKTIHSVAKRVISDLRKDSSNLTSGDSGLKTVWEEYCVQLQHQQSVHWDAYISHVEGQIEGYLLRRKPLEIEAAGFFVYTEMAYVEYGPDPDDSVASIIEYIRRELVDTAEMDYSNKRIRQHIESDDSY